MILTRRSVLRGLIAAPIVVRAGLVMPVSLVGIAPYGWLVASRDAASGGFFIQFNRKTPLEIGAAHSDLSLIQGAMVYSCIPADRAPQCTLRIG